MAKVTLEFDFHEEEANIKDALDGYKWRKVVWEIDSKLRNELKYNEKLNKQVRKSYEQLRSEIREILNDNELLMEI
jgi:hypothetical protein